MKIEISTYDFFNKFCLGLIFIGVVIFSFIDDVENLVKTVGEIEENTIITTIFSFSVLALVYEVGIIINRLGSLLEEFLKNTHLIPYNADYKKFNDRKKEYPIMNILSREYALSRNSIVLFLLISIIIFIKFVWYGMIPFSIMLLFYFSCYKYARKIYDLMK